MGRGPRHWGKGVRPSKSNKTDDDAIEDDYEDEEGLSVWEAADIWKSNGEDEDYMFGYTADELEDAFND